jgi:dolichol-phosphate mannosyltransferase
MSLPVGWEEMAAAIERVDGQLELETGEKPLVTGMDKYFISSQYAFYDPDRDGPEAVSGRHLFRDNSLMLAYWKPASTAIGKNVILVDFERDDLLDSAIDDCFTRISGVTRQAIEKNGRVVGHFYYRIGYGYQANPAWLLGRPMH